MGAVTVKNFTAFSNALVALAASVMPRKTDIILTGAPQPISQKLSLASVDACAFQCRAMERRGLRMYFDSSGFRTPPGTIDAIKFHEQVFDPAMLYLRESSRESAARRVFIRFPYRSIP